MITAYKADKFDLTSDIYSFGNTINPRDETILSEALTLLLKVKAQQSGNRHLEAQRNTDFSADVATLKVKLKKAQQRLALAKKEATDKGAVFERNEKQLTDLTAALNLSKENLGELFGVVRQVAGDFSGQIQGSVISAQYPQREEFINDLDKKYICTFW